MFSFVSMGNLPPCPPLSVVSLLSSVSRGLVQTLLQLVGSFSIHLTGNGVGSCEVKMSNSVS